MRTKERGLSLLELTIAMVVIILSIMALVSALLESTRIDRITREDTLAMNAARQMVETLRSTATFTEIYRTYNGNPADDPGGISTGAGPHFAVVGLTPQTGDPDGFVGKIEFPGDGGDLFANTLQEDVQDPDFDMPRDLDGLNGFPDTGDHSADYGILPVRILIEWDGIRGATQQKSITLLAPK